MHAWVGALPVRETDSCWVLRHPMVLQAALMYAVSVKPAPAGLQIAAIWCVKRCTICCVLQPMPRQPVAAGLAAGLSAANEAQALGVAVAAVFAAGCQLAAAGATRVLICSGQRLAYHARVRAQSIFMFACTAVA